MIIEMSQADSTKPLKMSGSLALLTVPGFDYDCDSRDTITDKSLVLHIRR